ncbi:MAG: exodeoxyribonuclease VII small subunit [Candidatus Magnetominusculus sp. LBB02]|nr:exodeoxyribonuclease VII small subunit [Candidatus Magnetominusculus sp. LBB02]
MRQKFKYSEALREIEDIISAIEGETVDVDVLTDKVKRAITLINACKARLRQTVMTSTFPLRKVLSSSGAAKLFIAAFPSSKLTAYIFFPFFDISHYLLLG